MNTLGGVILFILATALHWATSFCSSQMGTLRLRCLQSWVPDQAPPCPYPLTLPFLPDLLLRSVFLPAGRDIQQETFRASHAHWRGFSFVYNHYLFSGCFLVVLLAILLYLLRLRRIHRRTPRGGSAATLWLEEGLPSQKIAGTVWATVRASRDSKGKAIFASGFLLLSLIFFFLPFPFCSLKQNQNPLFVNPAVVEVLRLAVLCTALNWGVGKGKITLFLLHRIVAAKNY